MRTIAIVPARAGSRGISDKNIIEINGKTLLSKAIEVANKTKQIDTVLISTDSKAYEKIGLAAGAISNGLRPAILSNDTAKTIDVVTFELERNIQKFEIVVLLQPTSPLRRPEDLSKIIETIKAGRADSVVSVAKLEEPHPFKLKRITNDGWLTSFLPETSSEIPRQMLPEAFQLTGAIYATKIESLYENKSFFSKRTLPYLLYPFVNIDTAEDVLKAHRLMSEQDLALCGSFIRDNNATFI